MFGLMEVFPPKTGNNIFKPMTLCFPNFGQKLSIDPKIPHHALTDECTCTLFMNLAKI